MPPVYQSIFSTGYRVTLTELPSPFNSVPDSEVPYRACWVFVPAMPSTVRPLSCWNLTTAACVLDRYLPLT